MSRPRWLDRPRNQFRLLPPSQNIIAKAAADGVDTRSRPAIAEWRRKQSRRKDQIDE